MAEGNGGMDTRPHELYAQAQAARRQSKVLAAQHRAAQHDNAEILQRVHAARARAEQVHEQWLAARTRSLRYSAYARLQARLASMPVIEQAKGIISAQFGWPEDQAFDALRRVSQRENIKVRDLAGKIVAKTAQSAPAQSRTRATDGSSAYGTPESGHSRNHGETVSYLRGRSARRRAGQRCAAGEDAVSLR